MSKKIISIKGEKNPISNILWSSFLEHVGRAVYNGIYEPTHPLADENGFRTDVIDCVKQLKLGAVRYPGGNFVSAYDWKDGIGDRKLRKTKLNLAWQQLEPNSVGIDEFFSWCEKAGVEIIEAVNLGTKQPIDAAELLEYCNFDSEGYFANLRKENGREKPYGIKYWCVGNEMGGNQIGRLSSADYAKKAAETARLMKTVDGSVKLVVCGSCVPNMPVFPEWEQTVLSVCYDWVDYISVHKYYRKPINDDFYDYLNAYNELQLHIDKVWEVVQAEKEKHHIKKDIKIFFDEYNIWNSEGDGNKDLWKVGNPFFEELYTFEDALVLTNILITVLENSDKIECSCLAQLVNVIAPIMTQVDGGVLKQTTYYPFEFFSRNMKGKFVKSEIETGKIGNGKVSVDELRVAVAESDGLTSIVIVNNGDEPQTVKLDKDIISAKKMSAKLKEVNSFDHPYNIVPTDATVIGGQEITVGGKEIYFITAK